MLERRQYKRYKVNQNAFVFGADQPGRITDISLAGMAFSYICDAQQSKTDNISILDSDNQFFLEQIPCHTISQTVRTSDLPTSFMLMAQVSIAFELTPSQKTKLEEYINNHAIGNA